MVPDMTEDRHEDTSQDTISLSYQELAARLGIDTQSARRRVARSGWRKTPGNDGRMRVAVPADVLLTAPVTEAPTAPAVLMTRCLSKKLSGAVSGRVSDFAVVRVALGVEADVANRRPVADLA